MSKDDFDADKKAPTWEDHIRQARRWNAMGLDRLVPLKTWPACDHPQQALLDEYRNHKSYVPPPVQSGPEEFWEAGKKRGT